MVSVISKFFFIISCFTKIANSSIRVKDSSLSKTCFFIVTHGSLEHGYKYLDLTFGAKRNIFTKHFEYIHVYKKTKQILKVHS